MRKILKMGQKHVIFIISVGIHILKFEKNDKYYKNMVNRSILRNFYLFSIKKNNNCPIVQIPTVILRNQLLFLQI